MKNEDILAEAMIGEAVEHSMGVWEAVGTYKWAVFWSLAMSMCIV